MYAGDTGWWPIIAPRSIDSMASCFTCSRTFSLPTSGKKSSPIGGNLTLFLNPFQHPALGPAGIHQPMADMTADLIYFAGGFHPVATIMSTGRGCLEFLRSRWTIAARQRYSHRYKPPHWRYYDARKFPPAGNRAPVLPVTRIHNSC